MYPLRVFFVGGLISFRALFYWLSPWIYIPSVLIAPIFQILLFVYIGRAAHLASDTFYLIGNSVQYVAIPCLFGMAYAVAGERYSQTLGIVFTTPARRIPLFLGRSVPVLVNGCISGLFSLAIGALLLGVDLPAAAWPRIVLVVAVGAASCTGLAMINAAVALRVREVGVLSNILFGLTLIFSGANVPLDVLPGWMAAISPWIPLTHAIQAARAVADGAGLGTVATPLAKELAVGTAYFAVGLAAIAYFERESRRTASLERN